MTVEFALDYIPRRMQELGFGPNYLTRWRHFQIEPGGVLDIDAHNEFFYLIAPDSTVKVQSKFGVYDLRDTGINEMQYEHRGRITLTNLTPAWTLALFIQAIPTHK